MTTTAPPLSAELEVGLRRLKLSTVRRLAPELMLTAKTQRWSPEDFLASLIEAEVRVHSLNLVRQRVQVRGLDR
jgi:hypothetical protein